MAFAVVAALWIPASWAQSAEATAPCRVPGVAHEVRCGVVHRPLDPAQPGGPAIDIHFVVVPAVARRRLPDPVFLLAGGPGQSAIALAPAVLPLFARLNNRRDIVFVDQRGTGRSTPLECDDRRHASLSEPAGIDAQVAQLRACLTRLAATAPLRAADDLRFFTTTIAMQDLDAVRARLGAERINLVGASYGTRAALEYARLFPQRLRRSVLDGVAPPDMVLPVSGGIDTQAALDAMLVDCERSPVCQRSHPMLRADWQSLLASLPKPVSALHPLTGQREHFTLDAERVLAAVRGPLYAPSLAAGLPQAIGEAARGRYEPLLGLAEALASRRGGTVAMGMHLSVLCAEDGPRLERDLPTGSSGAGGASTPAPFIDLAGQLYRRACAFWPRGSVPEAFYVVPPAASATLLLSGGLDPATPPRHADRVARALGAQARQVTVANAGHGLMGIGCVRDLMFRFIDAADDAHALGIDATCVAQVPRPPAFEPMKGLPPALPKPSASRAEEDAR
ncbi:MAG: cysteine protease [Burkholderiales bacterium PBB1]|nr:MAG: cysteine protease [Burkholderiales bacterium PBB1]